jgi:hypothetical protein
LAFHEFEAKLRERRFIEDQESGVICRWRHDASQLILDAMPARGEILGFENRWHAEALPRAVERELPSGATIRAVSPPYLLATKLEAFRDAVVATSSAAATSPTSSRSSTVGPSSRRRLQQRLRTSGATSARRFADCSTRRGCWTD